MVVDHLLAEVLDVRRLVAFWAASLPSSTSSMPPIAAAFMNLVSLALSFEVVVVVLVVFDMLLLVDVLWAIRAGPTTRRPVRVAAMARLLLFLLMMSPLLSG